MATRPLLADSVESEMLNMDLKSIGAKSLPEDNVLRRNSYLLASYVRDISVSSMERFSDSSERSLLRFTLTDGHHEVRLESKVTLHVGIACLNPKVITVRGGVVQSLYEE